MYCSSISALLHATRKQKSFGYTTTVPTYIRRPKTKRLIKEDFDDFIQCYQNRKESERFRSFSYEELAQRDKLNLDIFWLKDDSLGNIDSLPEPDVLAAEIVENLEAALEQFRSVSEELTAERSS